VGLILDFQPIGKLIRKRISIIKEAAGFDEEAARIWAGTTGHPSNRARSGQPSQDLNRTLYVLTFLLLRDRAIIDPTIPVTDDFVAAFNERIGQFRILLQRPRDAKNADIDFEFAKEF
jgi:hypothetical protein